jgi:transitional endoplasmic reticulum ATPase
MRFASGPMPKELLVNAPQAPLVAAHYPREQPKSLLPSQSVLFEKILRLSDAFPIGLVYVGHGFGASTVMHAVAAARGGIVIGADQMAAAARQSTKMTSDAITRMFDDAFRQYGLVIVEGDKYLWSGSDREGDYVFQLFWRLAIARKYSGKLIIATECLEWRSLEEMLLNRCWKAEIEAFGVEDYRSLLRNMLGEKADALDVARIFSHASGLNCHQLRQLCELLGQCDAIDTAAAIAIIDQYILRSNVKEKLVEQLRFEELPGAEHIAEKLETHVVLPLSNLDLAERLDLRPKRGVLLYGPPGTGKTSIGRALAHRMKGKFFLIDGTIVTEPPAIFFERVKKIIRDAQDNAPSVLFIDDADVLFGIIHISGFARYLLTLLDGMESERAGKVCVVMTAMDVTKVPSAILRSGRVELWLETRLPDARNRAAILQKWIGADLPDAEQVDFLAVAEQAEGFTPADLRRIAGDARTYHAADELAGDTIASAQAYLLQAITDLIETRARMADNLRDENLRIGNMSTRAKYGEGIGGLVEADTKCVVSGW